MLNLSSLGSYRSSGLNLLQAGRVLCLPVLSASFPEPPLPPILWGHVGYAPGKGKLSNSSPAPVRTAAALRWQSRGLPGLSGERVFRVSFSQKIKAKSMFSPSPSSSRILAPAFPSPAFRKCSGSGRISFLRACGTLGSLCRTGTET